MQIKGKWLWIAQRITAAVLLLDAAANIFWWADNSNFSRQDLLDFVQTPWIAMLKMLMIVMLVVHAGLGLWAVGTDYIRPAQFGRAAFALRTLYEVGCLALLALVLWYSFVVLIG